MLFRSIAKQCSCLDLAVVPASVLEQRSTYARGEQCPVDADLRDTHQHRRAQPLGLGDIAAGSNATRDLDIYRAFVPAPAPGTEHEWIEIAAKTFGGEVVMGNDLTTVTA